MSSTLSGNSLATTDVTVSGTTTTANLTATDTTTLAGATTSADITFGDNDKAIFGAGSDLQIYHDGSNSFIRDAGTGNLVIRGTNLNLQKDGGEAYVSCVADGAVTLHYDNAPKLATTSTGIDVTGTATMDGLTVDGNATFNAGNYVSFANNGYIRTDALNELRLQSGTSGTRIRNSSNGADLALFANNGDISFYEDTGTTAKFFWDASAESLGIGTSSVGYTAANRSVLQVNGDTSSIIALAYGGTNAGYMYADSDNTVIWSEGSRALKIGTAANGPVAFTTNNTERMRIDSSGNLLVGANSYSIGNTGFKIAPSGFARIERSGTTSQFHMAFTNGNGDVGSISTSGSATAYNTSSDYRLKEDWQPVSNASDRVAQLKPVNFAWKADGTRVDGFLAHELAEVIPEAVTGEKDAMRTEEYEVSPAVYEDVVIPAVAEELDADGNVIVEAQPERTEQVLVSEAVIGTREVPDYQGIDQSKLVPLLTAALQEALARIETLEADVSALKGV